ncbi:MAG TPA: asparaginase [Burkholderiaceae bacterium]|nr:asparaginase [Burkholderiaceae bacterium]
MKRAPLPCIVLLGTGGTIASTAGAATALTDYTVTEGIETLLTAVPEITTLAEIRCEQVFNVDSRGITNRMLLKLAARVGTLLADPAVDGIVITHGTDTLEETAYFLNLTTKSGKPVVLTGAMRPGSALSADGPLNLYNAILLASRAEAQGRGVMVALNDRVHAARFVTKTDTTQVETFQSPGPGSLGQIVNGRLHLNQHVEKRHTLGTEFNLAGIRKLPSVDIIYDHQDAGPHLYDASIAAGVQGIVVAACGNGSLSPQAQKGLKRAVKQGIACVRSSRSGSGIVTPSQDDGRRGLVSGDSLNPQKARILLMLALTLSHDRSVIQSCFDRC